MKLQHFEKMEEKDFLKSFSNYFIKARKNLQIRPKIFFLLANVLWYLSFHLQITKNKKIKK